MHTTKKEKKLQKGEKSHYSDLFLKTAVLTSQNSTRSLVQKVSAFVAV
jgi:hypothetical protein